MSVNWTSVNVMQTAKQFQFQVIQGLLKDWTGKDQDKDKDLSCKDKDKD